ncbi:universal stress protein [Archaeoglobus veneficus]|uniref:UspA domain-containing protein n=1 Tax=Archaeoglobus veneficus (strain DSM 11195 / SNP6) TaxID=693661 RepID=F2KN74_ARCVS|nr:universal stress protein [Archaeoglobus veneficus]AEA46175.1 hypothetical protein Arcve_0134 [Archaeoglobus veneficus SNP6]
MITVQSNKSEAIPENRARVLLVISDSTGTDVAERVVKFVKSGFDAVVLVQYIVDMEPIPPMVSVEEEKRFFSEMREKGRRIVEKVISKLTSEGVDARFVGMHFGIADEEVLRAEKTLKPDVIIVGCRKSPLKGLSKGLAEKIVAEAKTPVLIAK